MTLVVTGMLNKQIAFDLGTSEKTIKVHRGQVMSKMQAGSLVDLVHMADRLANELIGPGGIDQSPSSGSLSPNRQSPQSSSNLLSPSRQHP